VVFLVTIAPADAFGGRRSGLDIGRSAWFVGVSLLVYLIFAMTLYLLLPRAQ